ncbi:hypothetical protein BO86DRAFT_384829 [Aspergillus japonicus CBS 114.51]|uniref:Uncharacterized protein n=1 Tax=Aspergillus japonicus CBS 114.51 TaxID=1448312 RepID=A0A8T8XF83_ASPJA|nr:hypothetical protein BO86DRAFT_384829 [Aspergillus japonicus CBS 114.51]RAH86750.1 hypothetical protein BO86DRAFT_384829 [Aspergillus japonicus CBS 114.51]
MDQAGVARSISPKYDLNLHFTSGICATVLLARTEILKSIIGSNAWPEAPLSAHRASLQVELVPELLARLRTEIGINKMLIAYGITETTSSLRSLRSHL